MCIPACGMAKDKADEEGKKKATCSFCGNYFEKINGNWVVIKRKTGLAALASGSKAR